MWSWYSWLVICKIFELTYVIQYSEYIHFSCSSLLICGFISTSAFGLMQSSPSCSTDMSPPKLSWNIYFYNIIMIINVFICMCRLISTAMSWGMLGVLTLTISPWQGSSLAGIEQIMSPTLGTSMALPDFINLFLGITGASAVISPEPWVTPLAKILTGRCWVNHVPNLRHLQWPFQFL